MKPSRRASFDPWHVLALLLVGCTPGASSGDGDQTTTSSTSGDTDSEADSETGTPDLPAPDHYDLFLAGPFHGDLRSAAMAADGRSAADSLCADHYEARWADAFDCATVNALLATADGGAPVSAPGDYALEPTAQVLAAATGISLGPVEAVFSGTLSVSFADAGLFADDLVPAPIWTGAHAGGNYGALDCLGWSSSDSAEQALAGDETSLEDWWSGASASCASERSIACLCH